MRLESTAVESATANCQPPEKKVSTLKYRGSGYLIARLARSKMFSMAEINPAIKKGLYTTINYKC
jgi:hypothetical protein